MFEAWKRARKRAFIIAVSVRAFGSRARGEGGGIMGPSAQFALSHGYAALFVWVLLSQLGVPLPAAPMLVAVGTLVASHRMDAGPAVVAAVFACLCADSFLFVMGRAYGERIVRVLCRISLESTTCIRATEGAIRRLGAVLPLVGRFVPGLGLVSAPVAGQTGARYERFIAFDAAGALIWAVFYTSVGRLLGTELQSKLARLHLGGHGMGVFALVALAVVGVVAIRLVRRTLDRRSLAAFRVTSTDLRSRMETGNAPFLIDLRATARGSKSEDPTIPGARRMSPKQAVAAARALGPDRDIVLACDCLDDAGSVHLAAKLRRLGFERVFPLEGGIEGWERAGYALVAPAATPTPAQLPTPRIDVIAGASGRAA
jgi:membrane protein DedA with SNARE-associated domain/rhodanese-related sulfurtransferase